MILSISLLHTETPNLKIVCVKQSLPAHLLLTSKLKKGGTERKTHKEKEREGERETERFNIKVLEFI